MYRVLICPSKPLKERVKVSHVIVECRVVYKPIIPRALGLAAAFRPSARASKGILHTKCRVINHHPFIQNLYLTIYRQQLRWSRYMTIQL